MGLLSETLLEAAAQDNAETGAEVRRLRDETRAAKRKLAQARRERALKAMSMSTTRGKAVEVGTARVSSAVCWRNEAFDISGGGNSDV